MQLRFDNSFARELPGDPDLSPTRRQVLGACYSRVAPSPVAAPYLIAHSREVAEFLGLSAEDVNSREFCEVFSGNTVLPAMEPLAMCYGGHQFGNWAGQLGDGRAISLGEVIDRHGGRQELQLKGAGPTPYSRMGDGRAVLRSSLREFLCSEAMHHLGVPTTRALSLVGTGDLVKRDMLYDGNERLEPGAIVCRVAPSFLRFGNFEIFTARDDEATLRTLAEYALRHHFPELLGDTKTPGPDHFARWFEEVCTRTAKLVIDWQRVGFVHGVLNTDNMSILGLTIDYGPYGWLENYDPNWTPNTTDAGGRRYRYGYQPRVAGWNLTRFAEALLPLIGDVDRLEETLRSFGKSVDSGLVAMWSRKLGFDGDAVPLSPTADDSPQLLDVLVALFSRAETDMTLFFRALADVDVGADTLASASDAALIEPLLGAYYESPDETLRGALAMWVRRYGRALHEHGVDLGKRRERMNATNPKYVLRNYLAQLAIDEAEQGNFDRVNEQLEVLRNPYDDQPGKEEFAAKRPDWARTKVGCSMLSCSS